MRTTLLLVLAVSVVLGLAGCGGDSAAVPSTPSSPSGAVLPGGGLSVAEAISTDADPPLAVAGWIVASGGGARLCSGYNAGASAPCIDPSLALKAATAVVNGTKVSLLGAVEGDTFVVSSTVKG